MSYFVDRLLFFRRNGESFSGGHGTVSREDRSWERVYRDRWNHDKVVRSTHGVNCTGSCSWKIYVKDGLVTWETQQTDYPRTRPDLPNHEPRGCPRGASYSWYMYSAQRVKYPLVRGRLMALWREARRDRDPVAAWESIVEEPDKAASYKSTRGLGGFVRATWDEVTELIAAANVYTIKRYGPDRVAGFSPIPAMSMVSFAAGTRYLSLIGGVMPSFYDWYCDLPPASPQIWGEQTDVPESADWYNSTYLVVWGSNVPQTRTPDAHFYTEVRYKGAKTVAVSPDYGEYVKFADLWLAPKPGTDAALAMAMGHVVLSEFHATGASAYFTEYCRQYSDMPMLVTLTEGEEALEAGRYLRASDFGDALAQDNNPDWKPVVFDEDSGHLCVPNGSVGFRWGEKGRWNLEPVDAVSDRAIRPRLTLIDDCDEAVPVAFPYFGGDDGARLRRRVPARRVSTRDGEVWVATVHDLMMAGYGVDRGLEEAGTPRGYDEVGPYTPAWAEQHTGVKREAIIAVAREFAHNADRTEGKSMVIVGAGINHWYHTDMIYRGIINLLIMCGCVGKSGGGWAHYVGQEKLRPQAGWTVLAFALDWLRPPRQMNGTSFWYNHTDQWRYEKLQVQDLLGPGAAQEGEHLIDFNVRAERMGWLPSAPQLQANPLDLVDEAEAAGRDPVEYASERLESGELGFACEDPDNPLNFVRNLFVWRSNLIGSSAKGHEYFLKHLLGTQNAVLDEDLKAHGAPLPREVRWRDRGGEGKLDLLVTLDFRMSSTCLYSDVVLPSATWYEKDDLNTSDMHPFIHPLCAAVEPLWESRTDWEAYKAIAKRFSELAAEHLGTRKDLVLTPLQHDTPGELGQALEVKEWKRGECPLQPGKTAPNMTVVTRDYGDTYRKFTALGPLMTRIGNAVKGIAWETTEEVNRLGRVNGTVDEEGVAKGLPRIDTARHGAETILTLAPETNGAVAVRAWQSLGRTTGRDHVHLAEARADERLRFDDLVAQPRKIITAPTWSGIESETVSYNAGYTNVHELIPWRTLTGRQQFYMDHAWMRRFGEGLCVYKPPVDTRSAPAFLEGERAADAGQLVLNWITPHQKWGIHSTYSDTGPMLTLSRGGPIVWLCEEEARAAGIRDNDWSEVVNINGALVARAILSQRIPRGVAMMYHAQDKIMNMPASRTTGQRGGIHNSVTRAVMKPTHMIGGYAQLAWGFNYYGTIGSNRDEYVVVRRLATVEWRDEPAEAGG